MVRDKGGKMKDGINKNALGLALGILAAAGHLVWLILIGVGVAKPVIDWILALHHLEISYALSPINAVNAVLLVMVTFVVGYVLGWIFAALLNALKKK